MTRTILGAVIVAAAAVGACSQETGQTGSVTGPALVSRAQLAQSTIAVLDGENGTDCTSGCRVSKWTNYPSEPPSPITFTQGGGAEGCVQAYGAGWVTTHMYCEEEDTCQPEDSWGLQKLRICAYQP